MTMQSLESLAYGYDLYTFDDTSIQRCYNPLDWLDWMRTHPRVVEVNLLPKNRDVVTLFAGYAGAFRNQQPLVYCTIMKPEPQLPEFAVVLQWYATEAEAREGHNETVARFRRQLSSTEGLES